MRIQHTLLTKKPRAASPPGVCTKNHAPPSLVAQIVIPLVAEALKPLGRFIGAT